MGPLVLQPQDRARGRCWGQPLDYTDLVSLWTIGPPAGPGHQLLADNDSGSAGGVVSEERVDYLLKLVQKSHRTVLLGTETHIHYTHPSQCRPARGANPPLPPGASCDPPRTQAQA